MSQSPDDSPQASQTLAAMAGLLFGERGMETILELLVSLAQAAMMRVEGASVSLVTSGGFETTTATSEAVRKADEVQHRTGRGPCVEAIDGGEAVNVELDATRDRWPEFAETALARGYRAVLSTPMAAGRGGLGALNLYTRTSGCFDVAEGHAAKAFADHMAAVVSGADVFSRAETMNRQLAEALSARDVVGLAKGILIAERGISAEEAFDVLRQTAKPDRKVRDVAAEVVSAHQARRGPNL